MPRTSSNSLSAPRKLSPFTAILLALVGVGGVVLSFLFAGNVQTHAENQFRQRARLRFEAIEDALREPLNTTRAVGAFYAGSQTVERDEFATFARSLFADNHRLQTLAWARRIPSRERSHHEGKVRARGEVDYSINDLDAEGHLTPAPQRRLYFPIIFLERAVPGPSRLGFDLGTVPGMRRLLERAARSQQMVVSAELASLFGEPPGVVLIVVEPVVRPAPIAAVPAAEVSAEATVANSAGAADAAQPRTESVEAAAPPQSWIIGCFNLNGIVQDALSHIESRDIGTALFDFPVADEPRLLLAQPSGDSKASPAENAFPADDHERLVDVQYFTAGDDRWAVVCRPTAGALRFESYWLPGVVLVGGLTATALLLVYLTQLLRRTAKSEALASRRAVELETLSNSALDAVIMMDSQGRVAHWNPAAAKIFGYARPEILGRVIHDTLIPEPFRQAAADGVRQFLARGNGPLVGRVLELHALHKDGREFPIELSVAPFRQHGEWFAVAIIRDITKRKQAEAALVAEQRSLRRMLNVQERDRKLVAYEIHDGLAQQLAGAVLQLQAEPKLETQPREQISDVLQRLRALLDGALDESRRLIAGLRPPILDEAGVVAAIDFLARGEPPAEFIANLRTERLEPTLEVAVFRIVQEALTNARRYSGSEKIRVSLNEVDGRLQIEIRDWGVGFDTAAISAGHYGLEGIRERARLLGGRATIESGPGEGTRIWVELPLVPLNGEH